MNKLITIVLIVSFACLLVITPASSNEADVVIDSISYHGFLTDRNSGKLVNDELSIVFRIYDVESGGVPIWEETHSSINIDNGRFSLMLGNIQELTEVDISQRLWLGVEINTDGEMTPRYGLSNLQTQMPDKSGSQRGKEEKDTGQTDNGQFGHVVIQVNINHNDIQSSSAANERDTISAQPVNSTPHPPQQPSLSIFPVENNTTNLQSTPVEDERIFNTEELKIYSNSPRAPG